MIFPIILAAVIGVSVFLVLLDVFNQAQQCAEPPPNDNRYNIPREFRTGEWQIVPQPWHARRTLAPPNHLRSSS